MKRLHNNKMYNSPSIFFANVKPVLNVRYHIFLPIMGYHKYKNSELSNNECSKH